MKISNRNFEKKNKIIYMINLSLNIQKIILKKTNYKYKSFYNDKKFL